MVEQLFGSKTRVKLLQLFFSNPNRSFYVREITRKIDEQINSVRRELANLLSIGIISSDNNNNKLYYEVNQKYEHYRTEVVFIRHYIFPGGFLPSLTAIADILGRATDLRIFHLEDIGAHYATTLRHRRERFLANLDRVRALGFPDSFIRMWEYYLCYCEGGFRERAIGTVQLLLPNPLCRREPLTPVLP